MTWIGSHLRSLRIERGLEQREVAERMHCTPSTVSHLETKGADVRMSTVVRYCEAIGARIHIAFPEEPAPVPQAEPVQPVTAYAYWAQAFEKSLRHRTMREAA